jgi:CheY-like chemotaxis protein
LIVDDFYHNRLLLREFVESTGINIFEAENGREAVELTRQHQPDIILMDLKMPVMSGYKATEIIKSDDDLRHIPIIAITASAMRQDETKVKKIGCNSFIRKPVSKKKLIAEIVHFLPDSAVKVTERQQDAVSAAMADISLSPDIRDRLPELAGILETELMDKWKRIRSALFVDEIEAFSDQIKKLGEKLHMDMLKQWGERLQKQAGSFDMDKLPQTLDYFPELVKKIRGLIDNQ